MKKYNDLMTPKEIVERNPNLKLNSLSIGWLRNIGLIEGNKKNNISLVSEKSVLEFHKLNYEKKITIDLDTKFNDLVDICNAITYFLNNADIFRNVCKTGIVYNIFNSGKPIDVNDLYQDGTEVEYDNNDFEINYKILAKISNNYSNLLQQTLEHSLNSLPKITTD